MHDVHKLGTLNGRLHNENTMHYMPLTCTYHGPMREQPAAPIRHIEPRNGQDPEEERFRRDDHYRPERGDRYTDRRRDDYDRDERRKYGYNRDRYEGDYSPEYDRRRDEKRQGNRNF